MAARDDVEDPRGDSQRTIVEMVEDMMMSAKTSGVYTHEEFVTQHRPFCVILEILSCSTFWLVYRILDGHPVAGLESAFPGQTLFLMHTDCKDHRNQAWRLLSYQFTHVASYHIFVNSALLFVLGLPLEGFHGHWRTMTIFNLGVIGGALFEGVASAHTPGLAGMSAGCYALLAMHWGDLLMNWRQSKFRNMKIILLILLVVMDVGATMLLPAGEFQESVVSHFSHLGGFSVGLLLSILIVRNLKVSKVERLWQAIAAVLLCGILGFCGFWFSQWAPRSLLEEKPWCWVRQVNNITVFHDHEWHCIACQDIACIRRWSSQATATNVQPSWCSKHGKWA